MSLILVGVNGAENGPGEPIAARQKAAIEFVEKERLSSFQYGHEWRGADELDDV